MSDGPEVSVVSAVYNCAPYIADAIRSLQYQTLDSWELLLVDDASSDDTVAIAEAMAREDARIRIIRREKNGGPAAARNAGIAEARGRWISVFDADDLMSKTRLHVLVRRATADYAAVVADNLLVFTGSTLTARPFLKASYAARPRWIGLAEFIDSNRVYSRVPNLGYLKPLLNTSILRKTGLLYDETLRIGEDYDLVTRLLARGFNLRLEPSAQYWYRQHPHSTSHRMSSADVRALLAADDRLAGEIPGCAGRERAAMRRRRRSLELLLRYADVVSLVKAGRYASALTKGISSPTLWPLLSEPLTARLKRLYTPEAARTMLAQP